MSAIRPHRWQKVYHSIQNTTRHSFEIIFIGPYGLPTAFDTYKNVKYIRDFGSPTRACQLGLLVAEGDIVVTTADDIVFLPNAINEAIALLNKGDYKTIATCKYVEGKDGYNKIIQPLSYFILNNAYPRSKFVGDNWFVFNIAFMTRKFLVELGGFDCRFEHIACALADLAVRSYKAGATVSMINNYIGDFDHDQPDHKPIELGQNTNDIPLYGQIHNSDELKDRIIIEIEAISWFDVPNNLHKVS